MVRKAKTQARRETLRDKLARELEEHVDEVVAAYLAGIRSAQHPHLVDELGLRTD